MKETTHLLQPISAVERDTGIAKDTLRAWEKRYGFPCPERDIHGERCYPSSQVDTLRHVKRLIDQGMRPGKILKMADAERSKLFAQLVPATTAPTKPPNNPLLELLRLRRSEELQHYLQQRLLKQGLQRFIIDTLAPANQDVGLAWLHGQINVSQEHLYTEQVQNLLRNAISQIKGGQQAPDQRPRILLTTLPDELHTLGLLMVEALCTSEGAHCVSLGSQMPIRDIVSAMQAGSFDILALCFSQSYPRRRAVAALQELGPLLPVQSRTWIGGALAKRPPSLPNCRFVARIEDTLTALAEWQTQFGHEVRLEC